MTVRSGVSSPLFNQRMVEVRNDSGETIPAFGVMRKTGHVVINNDGEVAASGKSGRDVVTVEKPNNYASQGQHLTNGPVAIENGKFGYAFPYEEPFGAVALDPADPLGLPAQGEVVGPVNGAWYAYRYVGGFRVLNVPASGDTSVLVTPAPMYVTRVRLDEALSTLSSANASPSYHDGSTWRTNSNETLVVNDILGVGSSISTTVNVLATWEQTLNGWIASSMGCEQEAS